MSIMEIPVNRWYKVLPARHSWRSYDARPVAEAELERLREICAGLSGHGARAVIVSGDTGRVFRGIVGSYGAVTGAPTYSAFIGDIEDINVNEKIGYLGEGVVLEAVALGLSTCWVGGFFRPGMVASEVGIGPTEKVFAVTPIGHRTEAPSRNDRALKALAKSHSRKPLGELCSGLPGDGWPPWVREALEAARIAPSATNRQPWRFRVTAGSITVSADSMKDTYRISRRLDCGIAMLHLELGARHAGAEGIWEYLAAPEVARFRVDTR